MSHASVGIVLKVTFHVSLWISQKIKSFSAHHQKRLLHLKQVGFASVKLVIKIANLRVDQNNLSVNIFFKKLSKNSMYTALPAPLVQKKHFSSQKQNIRTLYTDVKIALEIFMDAHRVGEGEDSSLSWKFQQTVPFPAQTLNHIFSMYHPT